jgi:long-chain acyl-CoA synthetase
MTDNEQHKRPSSDGVSANPAGVGIVRSILERADPTAPCLIDGPTGIMHTYYDVLKSITHCSKSFANDRKKLAFLAAANTVDSVLAYLTLLDLGYAIYLSNQDSDPANLSDAIERYKPDILAGFDVAPLRDYEIQQSGLALPVAQRRSDTATQLHPDLAILLSTSGTTGSCKFVRLSHTNILANAHSIATYLGLTPTDRAISMLPLAYSYGLSVLHSHLVSGASIVLSQDPIVAREFWQAFNRQGCTSLVGVPYTHQTLLKLGIFRRPPKSLRYVTQAGGRLDPALALEIHTLLSVHSIPFFVMYGQTEATARIAYLAPEQLPTKVGSIGKAIPGGALSIINQGNKPAGAHTTGEVVYRGPNVMMGYAESPVDLSRGDDQGGVLRTGDLGFFDQEGFFFLTGRMKRIAKILGMRINLDEVEALLGTLCPVAAVEVNDAIHCFYRGDSGCDIEQMRSFITAKLNLPSDYIVFRPIREIPRLSNGKCDYQTLATL